MACLTQAADWGVPAHSVATVEQAEESLSGKIHAFFSPAGLRLGPSVLVTRAALGPALGLPEIRLPGLIAQVGIDKGTLAIIVIGIVITVLKRKGSEEK